jgi:Transposase domain (DUF772)/Transposase DDE domain
VSLWLYAATEGVGSARELARLCSESKPYQWLCGGVSVNHHTLSDFRVGHGAALDELFTQVLASLLERQLVSVHRISQDGTRVRACCGASSLRRKARLHLLLTQAKAHVEELRAMLNDPEQSAALTVRKQKAMERAARERAERIERAIAQLPALEARQQKLAERKSKTEKQKLKEPRASTTDAEARVMKMPDGGFRPAYNGQFIADPKSGVILGVAVDTTGSDHGWIKPMIEQVNERFGRTPKELLVDGGFSNAADIEWAAQPENGAVAVFMAATNSKHGGDPYAPREGDGPAIAAWRARMAGAAGQAIYKIRSTHECINAHLRQRRLHQLTVRGAAKAKTIFLWHALAHNLLRAGAVRRAAAALPA